MSTKLDAAVRELIQILNETGKNKTSPYDTQAEVVRVDGDIAWVHIPGGVDETPVRLTMNAQTGDTVQVRVSGGSAWLVGNATSPPTDDTMANIANKVASKAMSIGEMAMSDAERAKVAADSAEAEANRARETAEGVETIAENAEKSAEDAQKAANSAAQSADTAFSQLSIVENVVGVLKLVSEHGQYNLTEDDEVVPDKWYFTRSGTAPNYVYAIVPNPSGDPSAEGWYELTGIDQAIQNYVSSQLVVDGDGLWLKTAGMQTKVLLSSTDGVVLYGTGGEIVGKYGATAQIGDAGGFHIDMGVWYKLTEDDSIVPNKDYYTRSGIDPNYTYTKVDNPVVADIGTYYEQMPAELGFYEKSKKVAYINNDQLYITKTVVLQQMQLGTPVAQGGADALGQWSWKVHPNKQTPRRNNLNLKWNG